MVAHIKSDVDLDHFFRLNSSLAESLCRLGASNKHASLLIDQMESIGPTGAGILCRLLGECSRSPGLTVVATCRPWELDHKPEMKRLVSDMAFGVFVCPPLQAEAVRTYLVGAGVPEPSGQLVELARSPLYLSFVLDILEDSPGANLSDIHDALGLWDRYRTSIVERVRSSADEQLGEETIAEGARLARQAYISGQSLFPLEFPLRPAQHALASMGVIVRTKGPLYRFFHDEVRDYLYAWDAAANRGESFRDVKKVSQGRSVANVLKWMRRIYAKNGDPRLSDMLKEALDV
jgi:hypothetical protein